MKLTSHKSIKPIAKSPHRKKCMTDEKNMDGLNLYTVQKMDAHAVKG